MMKPQRLTRWWRDERLVRDIAGVAAGAAGVALVSYGLWLLHPAAMYLALGAFGWAVGWNIMKNRDAEKTPR